MDCGRDLLNFGRGTLVREDRPKREMAEEAISNELILEPGEKIGFGCLVLRTNSCFIGERILLVETIAVAENDSIYYEEWLLSWDGSARRLGRQQHSPPEGLPQKGGIRATHWGITLQQIEELLQSSGFLLFLDGDDRQRVTEGDISVYEFVTHFVKPLTAGEGMGYALLVNEEQPLEVQVLVSHTWQEGILEFYHSLQTTVGYTTPLFVCFLSIYQNDDASAGVTIAQQLGNDPTLGPFAEVLNNFKDKRELRVKGTDIKEVLKFDREYATKNGYRSKPLLSCGFMVVVPTRHCNLYTRMWCCLELFTAANEGVPIFISKLKTGILDRKVSSRKAKCGPPGTEMNSDEISIRAAIEKGVGYDFVD